MKNLKPNQYSSKGNIVCHNKQGTSHSPNIRLLPQTSTKQPNNANDNKNVNNLATIKPTQLKKTNNVNYPFANKKKIQVSGDLASFQILQSNINSNIYALPYENILAQKQQQMMHNHQMNNMNNRFKRKSNKNIPRKSPIPLIKGQQTQPQHLLQILKPIKRNNKSDSNEALSRTFHEEKQNDSRSLSPLPRNNLQQGNQLNTNLLKHRFVSKSPILGRPTFLDRFKKFHITNNILRSHNSSNMMHLKSDFTNINVYKPNNILMHSNKEHSLIDASTEVNNKTKSNLESEPALGVDNKGNVNEKRLKPRPISGIINQTNMSKQHSPSQPDDSNDNITKVTKDISQIYTFSHVGFDGEKEKENNQDSFFIEKNFGGNAKHLYMSVCDGHGVEGHYVSSFLKEVLPFSLNQNLKGVNLLRDNINDIAIQTFLDVNDKLVNSEEINSTFSGSTCVSVIYTPKRLICLNVGDSRAVIGQCVNGKWKEVNLSRDHKPSERDEAKRIIDNDGRIQPFIDEGEFIGPPRVWIKEDDVPGLAMTRSFGDRVAATVGVISEPEISYYNFTSDDKFFIIASDGVWEFIENNQCINIIQQFYLNKDIKGCCEYLYIESKQKWLNEEEVVDDITMILVFLN